MSDIHIADFFKDAAKVLNQLYATFPTPATLFVEEISGPDDTDEFGMHSKRHTACFSAIAWLADEGFLRYDTTIRQDAYDQAVLTGRCFTVLSLPLSMMEGASDPDPGLPATVQAERATHIYRIRRALKQQSSLELRQAVMDVMRDSGLAADQAPGRSRPMR